MGFKGSHSKINHRNLQTNRLQFYFNRSKLSGSLFTGKHTTKRDQCYPVELKVLPEKSLSLAMNLIYSVLSKEF